TYCPTINSGESILPTLLALIVYVVSNPGSTPVAITESRTSAPPPCTTVKAFERVLLLPSTFTTVTSHTPGVLLVRLKVAVKSCPPVPTITGDATALPHAPVRATLAPL